MGDANYWCDLEDLSDNFVCFLSKYENKRPSHFPKTKSKINHASHLSDPHSTSHKEPFSTQIIFSLRCLYKKDITVTFPSLMLLNFANG